jgi:hypothetical protein
MRGALPVGVDRIGDAEKLRGPRPTQFVYCRRTLRCAAVRIAVDKPLSHHQTPGTWALLSLGPMLGPTGPVYDKAVYLPLSCGHTLHGCSSTIAGRNPRNVANFQIPNSDLRRADANLDLLVAQ